MHSSVQFVQSFSDAIEYNLELAAAVCTAVPHLSVQFVLSLDHLSVPSVALAPNPTSIAKQ